MSLQAACEDSDGNTALHWIAFFKPAAPDLQWANWIEGTNEPAPQGWILCSAQCWKDVLAPTSSMTLANVQHPGCLMAWILSLDQFSECMPTCKVHWAAKSCNVAGLDAMTRANRALLSLVRSALCCANQLGTACLPRPVGSSAM